MINYISVDTYADVLVLLDGLCWSLCLDLTKGKRLQWV
jgi:hypothetical protein